MRSNAKLLRRLIIVFSIFCSVVLLAIILLLTLVNPNQFKPVIQSWVSVHTGKTLVISGDIDWSFYPALGFKVHHVSLMNSVNAESAVLTKNKSNVIAAIKTINVTVKLLPLLKRQIEIKRLLIDGVQLNLLTNLAGDCNWCHLTALPVLASSNQHVDSFKTDYNKHGSGSFSFVLNKLLIKNAQVNWVNQMAGQHDQLANLNVQLTMKKQFGKGLLALVPTSIDAQGELRHYPSVDALNTRARIKFKLHSKVDSFSDQLLKMSALSIQGEINSKHQHASVPFSIESQLAFQRNRSNLTLSQLRMKLGGMRVHANLDFQDLTTAPLISGYLVSNQFDLGELLAQAGMSIHDPKQVLSRVRVKSNLKASAKFLKLTQLQLEFGKSHLNGDFVYTHFTKPVIQFSGAIDQLALKPLLLMNVVAKSHRIKPVSVDEEAKNNQSSSAPSHQSVHEKIQLKGSLKIKHLSYGKYHASDFLTRLSYWRKKLRLSSLRFKAYDGDVSANMVFDLKKKNYAAKGLVQHVALSQVLMQTAGRDVVSGTANLRLKLTSQGRHLKDWLSTLTGSVHAKIENITWQKNKLREQLPQLFQLLKKTNSDRSSNDKTIVLGNMIGRLAILNGVVTTQQLKLSGHQGSAEGKGQLNLNDNQILLNINLALQGLSQTIGGIPVMIKGQWFAPSVRVNLAGLTGNLLLQQVKTHTATIDRGISSALTQVSNLFS